MRPGRVAKAAGVAIGLGYAASLASITVRRRQRAGARVVAFAGGGAGGHVVPAIAIAEELRLCGVESVFLGEAQDPEQRLVPAHGFPLVRVGSVVLKRPLRKPENLPRLIRFAGCVLQAAWELVRWAPDVVVGTGGATSVTGCVAALALGLPLLLYEANALPDEANRTLHRFARRTLLAHASAVDGLRYPERCDLVGPVVRQEFLEDLLRGGPGTSGPRPGRQPRRESTQQQERRRQRRRLATRRELGLPRGGRDGTLLLVLGGSSGSGYINQATNNALPKLAAVPGLHVLWHTGARQHSAFTGGYAGSLSNVRLVPGLTHFGAALEAADLVLGRSGAATVAELAVAGTPALLVPSPAVSEQQQTANAKVLEDRGQAVVVPQVDVDEGGIAEPLLPLLEGTEGAARLVAMRAAGRAAAGGPAAGAEAARQALAKAREAILETGRRKGR
ncbi:hypothetical protein HYH03_003085 [Edaphochlamys debaryana]|uniref:Undecaprenyldiphospho-muramoylpentapeptide beta-N-acetylglucosaminyltransferase n=1 Tax=Edaphochlamys debaryana TaxID=47281 RepID=A0A836C4L3_9CHLO|nr:hypothetical protein HYH03_003085 [Edaphochlamys debaryana]|eukprot:KAG2498894.1 hypothetical protein HYH03_003085 [Edaphochlamys debaryana]